MAEYQKIGGIWKPVTPSIKVAGTWRSCVKHLNVGGAWKSMGASQRLWVPTDAGTDLLTWLDASDSSTITKDGANQISEWRDKSGNGRHARNPTGSSSPFHGTLNVNPAANAGTRILQFGQSGGTTFPGFYDLSIVSTPYGGGYRTLMCRVAGGQVPVIFNTGTAQLGSYTGASAFVQAGSLTWSPGVRKHLWATIPSATGIAMALDGGSMQAEVGENYDSSAADLTCIMGYAGGGQGWGELNEFLQFAPGSGWKEIAEGYQSHKWDALFGVTTLRDNLPSGHAYKSSPPMV